MKRKRKRGRGAGRSGQEGRGGGKTRGASEPLSHSVLGTTNNWLEKLLHLSGFSVLGGYYACVLSM